MPRYALRSLSVLGLAAVLATVVGAQAPSLTPAQVDRVTSQVVVNLLEQHHMAHPSIDDATAVKWAKTFLKDLDPLKYNFTKADVDEFMAQAETLDDKVKQGDTTFAKTVFDRFLKRSDERMTQALEILDKPVDFDADESISDDIDKLEWQADSAAANDLLRKRIKLQLLVDKVAKEPVAESVKKIKAQYKDRNRFWHQLKPDELLEIYLTALTKTFDPHSTYMSKTSFDELMNMQLHLSLTGIGALLESVDGIPTVKELVPKGPADLDGRLQEEDKILGLQKTDGGDVEEVSFVEMRLTDVVKQIRGEVNSKVRLIIQPKGTTEKKVYELTRQKLDLAEEHAKGQVIEKPADGPNKRLQIGVIHLPTFYGDTDALRRGDANPLSATEDCRKIIDGFKAQGVGAVVLDLRENGGGLLTEAISLSGLFINKGPVVQVRDTTGVRHLDDEDEGTAWDGPLVVLIDHRSASASEIFAGVIKDYGRGLIVGGSNTFGKGTVQSIMPIKEAISRGTFRAISLPDLGALKLTIQQFYRANGESTQVRGVAPDIKIPSLFDQIDEELEGKLDNSFKFDKIAGVSHDQFNRVPADLLTRLEARSETRRNESEKFRKLEAAIKKIVARKAKHLVPLNEAKYRAEVVSEDENQDEIAKEKKDKKRKRYDRPAWESNYYNDEIINIVADYLTLGSKALAAAPVRVEVNQP
jgi:carboxyl-terminal processing protease